MKININELVDENRDFRIERIQYLEDARDFKIEKILKQIESDQSISAQVGLVNVLKFILKTVIEEPTISKSAFYSNSISAKTHYGSGTVQKFIQKINHYLQLESNGEYPNNLLSHLGFFTVKVLLDKRIEVNPMLYDLFENIRRFTYMPDIPRAVMILLFSRVPFKKICVILETNPSIVHNAIDFLHDYFLKNYEIDLRTHPNYSAYFLYINPRVKSAVFHMSSFLKANFESINGVVRDSRFLEHLYSNNLITAVSEYNGIYKPVLLHMLSKGPKDSMSVWVYLLLYHGVDQSIIGATNTGLASEDIVKAHISNIKSHLIAYFSDPKNESELCSMYGVSGEIFRQHTRLVNWVESGLGCTNLSEVSSSILEILLKAESQHLTSENTFQLYVSSLNETSTKLPKSRGGIKKHLKKIYAYLSIPSEVRIQDFKRYLEERSES